MSDSGLRVSEAGVITISPSMWRRPFVLMVCFFAFGFPTVGTFLANLGSESVVDSSAASNISNLTTQVSMLSDTVRELTSTQAKHMYEPGHPTGMAMMAGMAQDMESIQRDVKEIQAVLNRIIGKLESQGR